MAAMFLSKVWRHVRDHARSKSFHVALFFSQCNPVAFFLDLDVVEILELRLLPYAGPFWGKVNFATVEVVIRNVTALMDTVDVHKAVSDSHWYRRSISWRQPCETASASLATIFALKPLGHERLRVKNFVTWISLHYLDAQRFGVLPRSSFT